MRMGKNNTTFGKKQHSSPADMAMIAARAQALVDRRWLSHILPYVVCMQAAIRGWLARRAQERARIAAENPERFIFGAFIGRWAPAQRYAYGRLEWAYFFPEAEGERLFVRVLALGLGLSYFAACFVTGMLLGLSAADRSILQDASRWSRQRAPCCRACGARR